MSCNGCRVLRKGCSEGCVLRHCLQCIDSPEAQANATLFVTKFFGRAGLTGFINGVSENQRPALFQSLLYEACGRTVNPVYGAVGLLYSGNWALCQAAVETVLRGGSPKAAAIDISKGHMKQPNSASALILDHRPAGSLSTLDHPAGFNITNSAAFISNIKLTQSLPAHESSLATSACSFKANSFHAAANHCVLDFSNYSVSSSAEEMIMRSHFNKRSRRDCKPETIVDEDPMIKRSRSSFLNGSSTVAAVGDPCDAAKLTVRRPSITTWIAGYNKANCTRIESNDCMINYDVYAPAGRGNHGEEMKHEPHHDVIAKASKGLAVQGAQEQLVAPVARRVYIPPNMKQELKKGAQMQKYGGVQMMSKSIAGGDDHIRSSREDCIPSFSCSVHQDTYMQYYECAGEAMNMNLDLSLQAQHGELCSDGELVNNPPHDTLELIKLHEEPHVLLRMSSPSVNSEGSVNTLVGGLDRSSSSAFECPKDGLKLLNLLL